MKFNNHRYRYPLLFLAMKYYSVILLILVCAGATAQNRTETSAPRLRTMRDTLLPFAPQLKIFPNPVQSRAELEVKYFDNGPATVQIVNNASKTVYKAERLVTSPVDNIVLMLQLAPGIYYCTVQQKQKRAKIKLVIVD